ncbi:hypothetical protein HY969_00140 [Candidatus Kaiserbacteria bacterium]|nr:hypothetical protein [Candidatus Kaiserbacteria bacterium]
MKRKGFDVLARGVVAGAQIFAAQAGIAAPSVEQVHPKPRQSYEDPAHQPEKSPTVKQFENALGRWRKAVDDAHDEVKKMLKENSKQEKPAAYALGSFKETFSNEQWDKKLPELMGILKTLSEDLRSGYQSSVKGTDSAQDEIELEKNLKKLTARVRDLFGMDRYNMKYPESDILNALTRWILENRIEEEKNPTTPQPHDGSSAVS